MLAAGDLHPSGEAGFVGTRSNGGPTLEADRSSGGRGSADPGASAAAPADAEDGLDLVGAEQPRGRARRGERSRSRSVQRDREGRSSDLPGDGEAPLLASPGRVELARVALRPGALTVRVRGFDPQGPRRLALWRVDHGWPQPVVYAESDARGRVEFPPVAVPGPGVRFVATPAAGHLASAAASAPEDVVREEWLVPPGVEVGAARKGAWPVRIQPRHVGGSVVVATPDEVEIGRYPVTSLPAASLRALEVWIEPGRYDRVLVAQTAHEGQLGPWREVPLDRPGSFRPSSHFNRPGAGPLLEETP